MTDEKRNPYLAWPTALALFTLSGAALGDDLVQVYESALRYDAQYAAARAAYQAGIERVPQAQAGLRPKFDLRGDLGYTAVNRDLGGSVKGGTGSYSLQLTQPLYRKQLGIAVDQAKASVVQFEAQLAQARQDLILRVAQAYFDVLLAQDSVALSRSQKSAISEQLAQAKRNFEVGTATITDTHEAQARYDLAVAKEIADQNDLEIKRRGLEQLIGRRPANLSTLKETVVLPLPTPNNMEEWVKSAVMHNPQVVNARAAREVAMKEIELNRAAYRPTVDAVASAGQQFYGSDELSFGGDSSNGQIGVQLNWPIWEGGARASKVRESVANSERARQELENAARSSALSARQSFLAVTSGVSQVKALEQALVSTQSALDSTRLGQEVGVRTSIDVLNAQQQLFQARRDLFAGRYGTILNQLRLKSATGLLETPDLVEVNKSLQGPAPAGTPAPGAAPAPAKPPAATAPAPAAAPAKPAAKPPSTPRRRRP